MGSAVVSATVGVAHSVGELVLDEIGMDTQQFIADGSRYGAKTVPSDGWKTREKARSYAGFGIFLELFGC